jgi:hypothetical protein
MRPLRRDPLTTTTETTCHSYEREGPRPPPRLSSASVSAIRRFSFAMPSRGRSTRSGSASASRVEGLLTSGSQAAPPAARNPGGSSLNLLRGSQLPITNTGRDCRWLSHECLIRADQAHEWLLVVLSVAPNSRTAAIAARLLGKPQHPQHAVSAVVAVAAVRLLLR